MITSARDLADVLDAAFSSGHGLGDDSTPDLPSPASESQPFVSIGRGSFGIIFALPKDIASREPAETSQSDDQEQFGEIYDRGKGMNTIVKRTILLGMDDNRWLENDAIWHERIEKTFDIFKSTIDLPYVPQFLRYLPKPCVSAGISQYNLAGAVTSARSTSRQQLSLGDWWRHHQASDRRWTNVHGDADHEYRFGDQILLAERIPAVPKGVRDGIIDRFAANSNPEPDAAYLKAIREHPSNDAALLRMYAGSGPEPRLETSEDGERPRRLKIFSLLNYPLNLPTMRELLGETQVEKALKMLGNALAVMHFSCGCDARDVEFVFGARPARTLIRDGEELGDTAEEIIETAKQKGQVREADDDGHTNVFTLFGEEVSMWLLDFNQVRPLPSFPFSVYGSASRMTSAIGIPTAPEQPKGKYYEIARREQWLDLTTSSFFGNDPYYPRPAFETKDGIWNVFSMAYVDAVAKIVEKHDAAVGSSCRNDVHSERVVHNVQLAREFLLRIEKECLRRRKEKDEREKAAAMEDWTSAGGC